MSPSFGDSTLLPCVPNARQTLHLKSDAGRQHRVAGLLRPVKQSVRLSQSARLQCGWHGPATKVRPSESGTRVTKYMTACSHIQRLEHKRHSVRSHLHFMKTSNMRKYHVTVDIPSVAGCRLQLLKREPLKRMMTIMASCPALAQLVQQRKAYPCFGAN